MARPKEYDVDRAIEAAMELFREHGFEGTSAAMLVQGMGMSRQSIYNAFGDKWRLYVQAVQRYARLEREAHLTALSSQARAIDGIQAMVERVVADANRACLGVNSICEFGCSQPELVEIRAASAEVIVTAITERVKSAQAAGDIPDDLIAEDVASFLSTTFAGIRIAARGGATPEQLASLGQISLRSLR